MPVITLTTDFGTDSPYVAQMKGVILCVNPNVTIVDVTHAVPAQDVRAGALVLEKVCARFPVGTIHVAVADPGVGTERKIVCAEMGEQRFIAPDNGLLSLVARQSPPFAVYEVRESEFWLPEVSATFHGRDIMAPVAAHLSLGVTPDRLGPLLSHLVQLDWPDVRVDPGRIEGRVVSIDSFGNLVTDISARMLRRTLEDPQAEVGSSTASLAGGSLLIRCGEHQTRGIYRTYGDADASSLVALIGSTNRLELAIVGGNAATTLRVPVGEKVTVTVARGPSEDGVSKAVWRR